MGDSIENSLINPNQLRHYGIDVQDNPVSDLPLYIMTAEKDFNMELLIQGTTIFANTYTPSDVELNTFPHVVLSSPQPWDPHNVVFKQTT